MKKLYLVKVKNSKGFIRIRKREYTHNDFSEMVKNTNKDVDGFTILSIVPLT